jgi:hypothetical protein
MSDAELERALADPDPLRGIAQLTARWAAAFMLDPAGVTRTKALGTKRMERKLRDALPGGEGSCAAPCGRPRYGRSRRPGVAVGHEREVDPVSRHFAWSPPS